MNHHDNCYIRDGIWTKEKIEIRKGDEQIVLMLDSEIQIGEFTSFYSLYHKASLETYLPAILPPQFNTCCTDKLISSTEDELDAILILSLKEDRAP